MPARFVTNFSNGRVMQKKGDEECPFCVTYDELKRRMEEIKEEK